MKRLFCIISLVISALTAVTAQTMRPQNKPYLDLRPLHFGISVGFNLQDIEFQNVGPQILVDENGMTTVQTVVCDQDTWNPGFSVGVLADLRLSTYLAARFSPTLHFGSKHLTFRNLTQVDSEGRIFETTQDLKTAYIAFPIDLKFSAQRFNNYRPYIVGGLNPMLNLSGKTPENLQLKRYDLCLELGFGCDFYLRFFKLIPELKFSYGLIDGIDYQHADELTDASRRVYAHSVSQGRSKMITLTFYFE